MDPRDISPEEYERDREWNQRRAKNAASQRQYRMGKKEEEQRLQHEIVSLRAQLASKDAQLEYCTKLLGDISMRSGPDGALPTGIVADYYQDQLPKVFSGLNLNPIHKRWDLPSPHYGRPMGQSADTTAKSMTTTDIHSSFARPGESTTVSRLNEDAIERQQAQKLASSRLEEGDEVIIVPGLKNKRSE
ncbi:hypothetical protein FRC20_003696 [Serendipita sp. 405]|nr:hypothetical protein FRC15_003050 [Serendipita sp. 397]KAG8788005.1 hypothetical protein FRC16_001481 [Serendipita sp. 398]KAG8809231.1 hypothetical protein FRC18_004650 [Serendipita sp. 400]KAG8843899.1 hypothetical protein FRC20_003696 [Serendipita sp. 405]